MSEGDTPRAPLCACGNSPDLEFPPVPGMQALTQRGHAALVRAGAPPDVAQLPAIRAVMCAECYERFPRLDLSAPRPVVSVDRPRPWRGSTHEVYAWACGFRGSLGLITTLWVLPHSAAWVLGCLTLLDFAGLGRCVVLWRTTGESP